jgi:hypothetical protein
MTSSPKEEGERLQESETEDELEEELILFSILLTQANGA